MEQTPEQWLDEKEQRYGGVTVDQWTKDGSPSFNVSYWAWRDQSKERLRVNGIGKSLAEAARQAQRREDVLLGKAPPEPVTPPAAEFYSDWFPC